MFKDRKDQNNKNDTEHQRLGSDFANHDEKKDPERFEKGEQVSDEHNNSGTGEQVINQADSVKQIQYGNIKKILLVAGAVLVLLLLTTGIGLLVFYQQIQETQQVILDQGTHIPETGNAVDAANPEETARNEIYAQFPEHIVNIGLLGFDRGWGREDRGHYLFRPDVQAVISIDFEQDTVSVIRIPRDSYVPIHGAGGFHDKINHSYMYGYYSGGGEDQNADGIRHTLLTISDVLGGIPIHYYISVDMYSVIALVYALGGVYYEVEERIVDEVWIYGVLLPPIEPGYQLLDGTNYMRILQYRDEKSSQDHGRIERQGKLLAATYRYFRENGRISDLPALYRIYKEYVDTDLSYKKMSALANYFLKIEITEQNLHFYTLLGSSQMKDGIYYEIISQEQRLDIIEKVFGLIVEPWPPIVLKDSPEYIQEQERKRLKEEGGGSSPQFPGFEDMRQFEDFFNQQYN
ncbi:MAG: LytR family transcriptional regulator [Firmicutes bacterium]|nr:LytR family transcriptional regulator [Bacillota bacterium]